MTSDQAAADDIREAITHLAASATRYPTHWTDRRAATHARINELLDQLELIEGWIEQATET